MNRAKQKGTKPRQILPNLIGQFKCIHEDSQADFRANFNEFSAYCEANSLKFSKDCARTFSCKELNCPVKWQ